MFTSTRSLTKLFVSGHSVAHNVKSQHNLRMRSLHEERHLFVTTGTKVICVCNTVTMLFAAVVPICVEITVLSQMHER